MIPCLVLAVMIQIDNMIFFMFQISNNQINIFKSESLRNFEDEMVVHIQKYFPDRFNYLKESGARKLINLSVLNAKKYHLTSKRNVCHYLNFMLAFGSSFDDDPQYPWINEVLTKEYNPNFKIDNLCDKSLEFFGKNRSPLFSEICNAFANLDNNANDILNRINQIRMDDLPLVLCSLYEAKFIIVGDSNIANLIRLAKEKAKFYKLDIESSIGFFAIYMFLLGVNFDTDVQFPWLKEYLLLASKNGNQVKFQEITKITLDHLLN